MGVILSFTAAVVGGWTDQGLSRVNDLMMSIPTLIFALIVLAVLPQELWILVAVIAVLESTRVFRIGRAVAMDVAVMEFVEARSEEHTSELQSLMRISYAVFCLKKKKN